MIRLRPHHLLCYAFYEGKGYDEKFVDNMNQIYKRLEKESIVLVADCDALCQACPHQVEKNSCATQEKVTQLDKNVLEYFDLKLDTLYNYPSFKERLKNLDSDTFQKICSDCQWYQTTCKIEKLQIS